MIKVDASAPTAEEHQAQAVTKLRYMDFRDNMSSSRSLGFRIEALKVWSVPNLVSYTMLLLIIIVTIFCHNIMYKHNGLS